MSDSEHKRLLRVQRITPDLNYRVDYGLSAVPRFLEQYNVDLDPDYQRGLVWTKLQKRRFVGFVIQNHSASPIFWFNWTNNNQASQVVDGKQRINAILGWLDGKYDALCPCGERFWYSDRDEIADRGYEMSITLKMHLVSLDRASLLRFYIGLNSGGVVHDPKEISRVKKLLEKEER